MTEAHECWRCGAATANEMLGCYQSKGGRCVQSALYRETTREAMRGQRRLYCDMDGVLADFDAHHRTLFGQSRTRHTGWSHIQPGFFRTMPAMSDAPFLWNAIKHLSPLILTGCPRSVDVAANEKIEWAHAQPWIGPGVAVICCRAKKKNLFCRPGDILIDDSAEYRPLWEEAGGVWVQHRTAAESLQTLSMLGVL